MGTEVAGISFDAVKPGDVLYRVYWEQAGNTTLKRQVVLRIDVVEKSESRASVLIAGHTHLVVTPRDFKLYQRSPPEFVKDTPLEPARCYFCRGSHGVHTETCMHPAAVRARKRRSKQRWSTWSRR